MYDCSISTMKRMVAIMVKAQQVPMIHSGPGLGKSASMKQICAYLTKLETDGSVWDLNDCRLSQKEPTDLTGLPFAKDGFTCYLPPKFMPYKGKGLLFFDEVNRAERPTIQSAFQIMYDRISGEYKLPDGWSMAMAGNLGDEDMTNVNELDSAFCGRLAHLRVTALQNEWEKYMKAAGDDYNDDIEPFTFIDKPNKDTLVVDFLRGHDMHFMGKPVAGAYPSPRTWQFLNKILNHIGGNKAEEKLAMAFAIAYVGEAAGLAFGKWFKEREEFKPTLIIDDYNDAIKKRFSKLSGGYQEEVYANFGEYVNKMTKFTDKQKKNLLAFVFDTTIVPEEKAVSLMRVWADNTLVIGVLQAAQGKFLSYFKRAKDAKK